MGYEIEMSLDLRKNRNVTSILDGVVELAENNDCDRHFQFSECEGEVRRLKRSAQVLVFCFEDEKFTHWKVCILQYPSNAFFDCVFAVEIFHWYIQFKSKSL